MRLVGKLKLLGHGKTDSQGWTVRAVTLIGDVEVHNLRYSDYLGSFIDSHVGETVALGTYPILGNTVYAAAFEDGSVRKELKILQKSISATIFLGLVGLGLMLVSKFFLLLTVFSIWAMMKTRKELKIAREFSPLEADFTR